MAYTAADVPAIFDLFVNGQGYRYDQSYDDSPFRKAPAEYGYTQTFLERTNVGSAYGDDSQSFFLTASQNDWSEGEQQKFLRVNDVDSARRFWQGQNVDVRVPGQVTLRSALKSVTAAANILGIGPQRMLANQELSYVTSTRLYTVDPAGAVTDQNVHGVTIGTYPQYGAIAADGNNIYIAHTAGVRKWTGAAFSDFSATAATAIEYLNNALYGYDSATAILSSYSTAGAATTVFTWKDSTGAAQAGSPAVLRAYGGTLLILRTLGIGGSELWQMTGPTTVSLIYRLPANFYAYSMIVANGIVYIGGSTIKITAGDATNLSARPSVYFYLSSGNSGLLWQADGFIAEGAGNAVQTGNHPALASIDGGVVFNDDYSSRFLFYDLDTGGIHCIGTYAVAGGSGMLVGSQRSFLSARNGSTAALVYPDTTAVVASGYVISSLIDFDSSLQKQFRGVIVDFTSATDGNGGSVDIAYQVGSVDGSWTTLQASAASGTEYQFTSVSGRSIAIKVTLNKGTSTAGPVLKRIYVRAAPVLTSFRNNLYILDCSGNKAAPQPGYLVLNNGFTHDKDGVEMVTDLQTAIAAGVISVTDRYGTFNGIIEPGATIFKEVKSTYGRAEYRVELAVRGV